MEEKDLNLTSSKKEDEENKEGDWVDLLGIINTNVDILIYLNDMEGLNGLYDAFQEDKIKCVISAFKTIELAQNAVRKQIKNIT